MLVVIGAAVMPTVVAPAAAATLDSLSDRTHKANLLRALGYNPRLVFFGGSRSLRFEPSYGKQLSGLRGFNAAFINGTTEDVWAFSHYLVRRAPGVHLRAVWGISLSNFFTSKTFDTALISDGRLNRWFPLSLRRSMGSGVTHKWSQVTYLRDGADVYDNYDRKEKAGRTLDEALDAYIAKALQRHSTSDTIVTDTRAGHYFVDTLTYLNEKGCEPLVIIMPLHPRVIRAIRDGHWDNRRQFLHGYLTSLQETLHFTWLDLTFISTFDGDPSAFYDGDHLKRSNMRRLLKAAVKQAPWAFGLAPAPWDPAPTEG